MASRIRLIAIAICLLATAPGARAVSAEAPATGSPTSAMRQHFAELATIVRDPMLTAGARRSATEAAIGRTIDFAELSRRALGGHWSRMTPVERTGFSDGLRHILGAAYASVMARYLSGRADGNGDSVRFVGESVSTNEAQVRMTIPHRGLELPVTASLVRQATAWRVYDVAVWGVSLTENVQAQVTHLSPGADYRALLTRLDSRQDSIRAAAAQARR